MAASAGRCSRSPIVKPGVGFVKGQVPLSFLTSAVVLLAAVREEEEKKKTNESHICVLLDAIVLLLRL